MNVAARVPEWCVVFDGQSLNVVPPGVDGYPAKVMAGRSSAYVPAALSAVGASSWTTLAQSRALRINPHADAAPNTVLVMMGGTFDVVFEADTGAQLYADHKTYAEAAKAAGFDKVVVLTITPTTDMGVNQNNRRRAGNDLLIGNADAVFDAVVDVACDSTLSDPGAPQDGTTFYGSGLLSDPSNTTYYSDGVHFTNTGAQACADDVAPALTFVGAA